MCDKCCHVPTICYLYRGQKCETPLVSFYVILTDIMTKVEANEIIYI